jgi:hypothetical protein
MPWRFEVLKISQTDRESRLCARAGGEDQRRHAHDHRRGRHQNRAEADRSGLDDRVTTRQALLELSCWKLVSAFGCTFSVTVAPAAGVSTCGGRARLAVTLRRA